MAPSCNGLCRVHALKTLCETWFEKLHTVSQIENTVKPSKVTKEQVLHICFGCASLSWPTRHHALQGASTEGAV